MTAEHFDAALETLMSRRPFQVFTVELYGGRQLEIDHPGALMFAEGIAVYAFPGGIKMAFDHDSANLIIDAPHELCP